MALKWRWHKGLARKGKVATLEIGMNAEAKLMVLPEMTKVVLEKEPTGRFVPFVSVSFTFLSSGKPEKDIKKAKDAAVKLALQVLADVEAAVESFVDNLTEEIV